MKPFAGFPAELFDFLLDLANNNNRAWFDANRERYKKEVVKPVTEFVAAMADRLPRISACFVADPRPNGGSMFRIYRDTRFSRNKRPYKENVGCQFRHVNGKSAHAPGYYVHLEPSRVFFGGGLWKPDAQALAKIRSVIADSPRRWSEVTGNRSLTRRFNRVTGDTLLRAPRGFDPKHPCIEDIKRKSFVVFQNVDPRLALTPNFINEVDRAFTTATPFMEFLTSAVGLPFSRCSDA